MLEYRSLWIALHEQACSTEVAALLSHTHFTKSVGQMYHISLKVPCRFSSSRRCRERYLFGKHAWNPNVRTEIPCHCFVYALFYSTHFNFRHQTEKICYSVQACTRSLKINQNISHGVSELALMPWPSTQTHACPCSNKLCWL